MRTFVTRLSLLAAIFLWFCPLLHAQTASAITGVVTDVSGGVVPDTVVTLSNPQTAVSFTAKTGSNGSYRFTNVPAGPGYTVTFTHEGFAAATVNDMYLNVGVTRTQDAHLSAGASVKVEVSAANEGVTLNTTDASIGNNFDVRLLNDLPIQSRTSPAALFTLQAGYANGSFTGARSDQNSVTVDGMDVNDIAAGSNLTVTGFAPVDSVQEFRGTVGGLTANQGTGSGGQFQLVTKSGTNRFHGNLNEYHRDTSTVANNWFNNNVGIGRTPLIRNQFGGNIGGPILKDKLFFFFDFNNSRIVQSSNVSRTVPLDSFRNGTVSYIKATANGAACNFTSRQNTTPACIGALTSAQVATLDPQHVGFNSALLTSVNQRYPHANDLTGGDGINTGLYRFTTPTPDLVYNYVGRLDYNLTSKQRVFARLTIGREDATESTVRFPTDPITNPYQDRSYGYVVSHIWEIGQNKVNQFYYGDNISKLNFPTLYNPTGTAQYTYGGGATAFLSAPYNSGSAQKRRVPIPEVRDDFNWQVGHHTLGFGGTFKFIKTNSQLVNDFNFISVGLGGANLALDSSVRPTDIRGGSTASGAYDNAFAFALGRIGSISSNYNYDASGKALAQGTGEIRRYRFFQTELYASDTWKVNPQLTLTYGLRYQLYSVPYEVNGAESVQNLNFDSYFAARLAQSSAGVSGPNAVPFMTYQLGGKANNGPNIYSPSYKDIAPRFAFAYNPSYNRKLVVNGSAAMVYDRTVINAINFIQDQNSYLFQNSTSNQYGASTAQAALLGDPRLGANLSFPAPAAPPTITKPFTPNVDPDAGPYGLTNNLFNALVDPNLKTPYSIAVNFGIQQELPAHMLMKINYAGRFGRRLLAQADASQLIDFPDASSTQMLSNAFGNVTKQLRQGVAPSNITPQPWFENQIGAGYTQFLAGSTLGSYMTNGDFADFMQALAFYGLIDSNVGLDAQFAGNTFYTNKGFSTYHGLLFTLQKNFSQGLQFDFNYTMSHSMDNTSQPANSIASGTGYGFICDVVRPRECRANSDFDVTHVISSDFVYDLPFGRKRPYMATAPIWLDELIGGWQLSGTPGFRSGLSLNTTTDAYVAGYANNAPAIFTGTSGDVNRKLHKDGSGTVFLFSNPTAAVGAFTGPVGFQIGSRNSLRGPSAWGMDAGLAKNFIIIPDNLNLRFRADAFNIFNHPVFSNPTTDILSPSNFGQITSTTTFNGTGPRVMQFALRLEF